MKPILKKLLIALPVFMFFLGFFYVIFEGGGL